MAYHINNLCKGCGVCLKICPSNAISGEKRTPHTIKDNVCIECGACGKTCPYKSIENSFGQICNRIPKKLWRKPIIDKKKCLACIICIDACPTEFLELDYQENKKESNIPVFSDENSCLGCGFCAYECPVEAIKMEII
jgi:NAD-dependent dihydropyrimidine dehydrogenase PreA subunit